MKVTKFFNFALYCAIVFGAMTMLSCKPELEPKLKVGQKYQGGIIAYIDATGEHGLIAALEDQSTGMVWWNGSSILTGAALTAIGTGKSNTDVIVAAQGAGNYAANLCKSLNMGGYSDWFLPSLDELSELFKNKIEIGGFDLSYDGKYVSSSEHELASGSVWVLYFGNGKVIPQTTSKSSPSKVRAVRYF